MIGALNRRSSWALARRRRLRRPPWQAARFLTRRRLLTLGGVHGRATLHGALFIPGVVPGLGRFSPSLEALDRRACPASGAFQILTIEKAAP